MRDGYTEMWCRLPLIQWYPGAKPPRGDSETWESLWQQWVVLALFPPVPVGLMALPLITVGAEEPIGLDPPGWDGPRMPPEAQAKTGAEPRPPESGRGGIGGAPH